MNITQKDVENVARLARLELSDKEKEQYLAQLGSIFEYIAQLGKLDTSGIQPTSHVLDLKNVWREDEAAASSDELRERLLNNAPEREGDFFKVRKVIE